MAVELKCQGCGAVLTAEAPAGTRIVCPQCKTLLAVPEPAVDEPAAPEAVVRLAWRDVVERGLPLAISVAMHAALLLIMAFIAWATVSESGAREQIVIPSAHLSDNSGGSLHPGPADDTLQPAQNLHDPDSGVSRSDELDTATDASASPLQGLMTVGTTDETASKLAMAITGPTLGGEGAGGPMGPFFTVESGGGPGPRSQFFGAGGASRNICYVIDRSGSLTTTFEFIKKEMQRSIEQLEPQQLFHVIFFNAGEPIELPMKRLIYASDLNKVTALRFINSTVPYGQTDPRPAFRRALAMTPQPDIIYFLTDGEFDRDIVLEIRRLNPGHKTRIFTYAFGKRSAEDLLKQIAFQNGGSYTYVDPEMQAGAVP